MDPVDFTIVTPSYNYGQYIDECLQSVANQKGVTFEHLVMDACSTDQTEDIVGRHPHAKFYRELDGGMSEAVNKGFRKASGSWLMWLNADDRLLPGALAAVKQFADIHADADVIYGCWNFMDRDGNHIRQMTVFPFVRSMLSNHGCYIASTSTFFRKSSTVDDEQFLNEAFRYVMDGEYFCRLAYMDKQFRYIPKVLADFRLHDENLSQKHLNREDIDGVLAYQRQYAESRTIRRMYGIRLFRDEMLNSIVDGFLYHGFRLLKGALKIMHRHQVY